MNIQIQSINFAADKQLKDFVNKKVDKLISINDRIINADVYLKVDNKYPKSIKIPSLLSP